MIAESKIYQQSRVTDGGKKVTENKTLGMATQVLVVVNSKLSFLWYN